MKEVFDLLGRKLIFTPKAIEHYFYLAKIRRGEDEKFRIDMDDIIYARNADKLHDALFDHKNEYFQEVRFLGKLQIRNLLDKESCPDEYYTYFFALRDVVEEHPALSIPTKLCNAESSLLDSFLNGPSEGLLDKPIPFWMREALQAMLLFPEFVSYKDKVQECCDCLFLFCTTH